MTDFDYDPTADQYESYQWQSASDSLWALSSDFQHLGDDAWQLGQYEQANEMYQYSYQFEDVSAEAYQQSWDAWYGPVNAEGYTMYDAAQGYTSTDTSFIEPASSAGSMSMISDNSASSYL